MRSLPSLLSRSGSFWFWLAGLTLLTLLASQTPLLAALGYEFSLLLTLPVALAAGWTAIIIGRHYREQRALSVFGMACLGSLPYLLLPFLLTLFTGGAGCNFWEGIAFYLLMPGLTLLYATGWGLLWQRILRRPLYACIAFVLFLLSSLALTIIQTLRHPPLFAYNHFFGYFAGPIYDEVVQIPLSFLLYRGISLLHLVELLCVLTMLEGPPGGGWQRIRTRQPALILFTISAALLTLLYLHQGELGIFTSRAYLQQVLSGRYETPHFRLFYPPDSRVAQEIEEIGRDHEFRYSQVSQFLQVTTSEKLVSYIYASPEQKKRLIGAGQTMIADPFNGEMHLNYRPFPHPTLKHELTHLLSTSFAPPWLKINLNMGLVEGIAEATAWQSGELTPHQWSRAMFELGLAPPLDTLLRPWSFWLELPARSYLLTGSFVRYLIDTYGIDKFKAVYRGKKFMQSFGKSLSQLQQEWETFLQSVPLSPTDLAQARASLIRPPLVQRTCAHEIARLKRRGWKAYRQGDYSQAARYFAAIQRWNPRDAESQRGLLASWYAGKNTRQAYALSARIIAEAEALPLLLYAHNVRGDLLWEAGKRAEARQEFLWIQEHAFSSAYKRLAAIKLAALNQEGGEQVRYALSPSRDQGVVLFRLHQLIVQAPAFAPAYYLLGRRLLEKHLYREAARYLQQAVQLGLPEESLHIEAERLLGIALYHLVAYGAAQRHFQQVVERGTREGIRLEAGDWIARCRWEEGQNRGASSNIDPR
ncbi:MAG: hypothetical protein D6736_11875 [Nitrospinota bacterium]|nr:MAG: hypothetical protein D6736_11875 [Nitrospinota bacterium]